MTSSGASSDIGCPSGLSPSQARAFGDLSAFETREGETRKLEILVSGARCGGCLSKIETALNKLEGVTHARLNLSTGRARIEWRGALSPNTIASSIDALGYGVSIPANAVKSYQKHAEERDLLLSLGVAGFAAANIMLLSVSVWAGHGEMGKATRTGLHVLSGIIAFPVLLFSGRHFIRSAWGVLRRGHANMDVPISLALILSFSVSVYETITGGPHAYFDAVVMLLFFLLIGRFLDARLKRQAFSAAHQLAAFRQSSVSRFTSTDKLETVASDQIVSGDKILLSPGERAVVNFVLEDQEGLFDTSLVTGETVPVTQVCGQTIYAGSVNVGNAARGRALGTAANSLLSDIENMLEAGEQKRSAYRKIADKAVSLYVPLVHLTALLAFLGWLILGASVRDAIMVAITTLIITCPCALALAAPVVQVVAAGRLFRQGIFLRSGDALERFAEVNHIVFDKTGTLTLGEPKLKEPVPAALEQAAQLARASHHPLSRAIVAAAGPGPIADDVRETPGRGLEGVINGKPARLGSAAWCETVNTENSATMSLWFRSDLTPPTEFSFEDTIKPDAGETVTALAKAGLTVEILSGDATAPVKQVATLLGIYTWQSSVSPSQKAERLEILRRQGHRTLMVGDGMNDVGALSLAHASVVPGGALDISKSAADAVFSKDLKAIPVLLEISRRSRTIMQQNFALAALYNLIAVPIAVTGNVTPLIAAIAMSASSLIVTLNALRLNLGGGGERL